MPIYEYVCKHCAELVAVTHRTLGGEDCPESGCDGVLRRRWNAPGVHFNADGFYATRDDPSGKFQKQRRAKRAKARRNNQAPDQ